MKLPQVISLILCERLAVDPAAGQTSLSGLFFARSFRSFPSPPQRFTVFALFFDGEGEGTMELVCTRLENEQDVWNYHRWYTFPGRGLPAYLEVKATKCVFPAPGRYRLKLRFDSQDLTERYFDVVRLRGRS